MAVKNAFYAQSGGVSAVINASACGVLETACQQPEKIGQVYAGRNGIIGALTEDLIDTSLGPEAAIAAPKHTPGAAFGSLAPLIVGEAYPPFKHGLPDYVKLRNAAAPKKLTTKFAP